MDGPRSQPLRPRARSRRVYTGGEYEAEPGVYVGATARAYEKLDVRGLNTFCLQTEMRWGAAHLRVGIVQYLRYLDKRIA